MAQTTGRVRNPCQYREKCFRKNPHHFKEYSHPHLESIIESTLPNEDFKLPDTLQAVKQLILEQIKILIDNKICTPKTPKNSISNTEIASNIPENCKDVSRNTDSNAPKVLANSSERKIKLESNTQEENREKKVKLETNKMEIKPERDVIKEEKNVPVNSSDVGSSLSGIRLNADVKKNIDYIPIVEPQRDIKESFSVVLPKGKMFEKHKRNAPYFLFYTTIKDSIQTHFQSNSITFQELLDRSLGELKCSLHLNFMIDIGWLLAHYYYAGYSNKRMTVLYGEDMPDLQDISRKRPNIEAHKIQMSTPFGKHHTKLSLLCYEDGSLRVVISTANLYTEDWENRTQSLWFSPSCPLLPDGQGPNCGESKTNFKRSLIEYLSWYRHPVLAQYIDMIQKCDFGHINVFLVASVPGSHSDNRWGMSRVSSLLEKHVDRHVCSSDWSLIAQSSSIGSYGPQPQLWLTGDFLTNFTKTCGKGLLPSSNRPSLKLIYPSLENVRNSHDNLLGGGCLPYSGDVHCKQVWLQNYLHQWKAKKSFRDQAMPHIKSYLRLSPCNKKISYLIITSGNVSKAAWGTHNKGNGNLRLMSYEAGVLFLPKFVINKDYFDLEGPDAICVPYDLPPIPYEDDMTPFLWDYLK